MPYDRDGKYMSLDAAIEAFLPIAFEQLVRTAKVYNAVITYKELAQAVKDATGIRYDAQLYWVGKLLGPLVWRCVEQDLPPLTALVVHAQGTVGTGYSEVLEALGLPMPEDPEALEDHAAAARLECYRYYGAELPPGGGEPSLTPAVRAAREAKRAKARAEAPPELCPIHFVTLPVTGVCDMCD